jgi:hypothetical protein
MSATALANTLREIEAELVARGIAVPAGETPLSVDGAFGGSALPFEHWLARVFVPAARQAIRTGDFPARSQVGVAAVRNFDGREEMGRLTELLGAFDALVEALPPKAV